MMTAQDNSWMVGEVASLPDVRHVIVLSADGLVMARSGIERDAADRLAATCSGLQSLGGSVGTEFGGSPAVGQILVAFDGGYLFTRAAGEGSHLAVVTGPKVDANLIGAAMQTQATKLVAALRTPARTDSGT